MVVDARVDVAALRSFVAQGRDETTPFDVAMEGTTVAALNSSVTILACTLAPGLSFSPGFGISIQT